MSQHYYDFYISIPHARFSAWLPYKTQSCRLLSLSFSLTVSCPRTGSDLKWKFRWNGKLEQSVFELKKEDVPSWWSRSGGRGDSGRTPQQHNRIRQNSGKLAEHTTNEWIHKIRREIIWKRINLCISAGVCVRDKYYENINFYVILLSS